MKWLAGLVGALTLAFVPILAQAQILSGPGGNPANAVGVWGVNSSGQPCVIAPVGASGAITCWLPPSSGGGGGSNVDVTQFGGSNVVTGTGASGAGIPRFTVSTDSTVGITGTLPAFTTTPTFNCGTGCFQTTQPVGGAVTTGPPSYTTGTNQALSITTLGDLRAFDQTLASLMQSLALTPPLPVTGSATTAADLALTTGGTAQTVAGGAPTNGFMVCNPSGTEEAWVSDSTTAAANTLGSFRLAPNGGCYVTPTTSKPAGAISIIAATTAHPFTIRKW